MNKSLDFFLKKTLDLCLSLDDTVKCTPERSQWNFYRFLIISIVLVAKIINFYFIRENNDQAVRSFSVSIHRLTHVKKKKKLSHTDKDQNGWRTFQKTLASNKERQIDLKKRRIIITTATPATIGYSLSILTNSDIEEMQRSAW